MLAAPGALFITTVGGLLGVGRSPILSPPGFSLAMGASDTSVPMVNATTNRPVFAPSGRAPKPALSSGLWIVPETNTASPTYSQVRRCLYLGWLTGLALLLSHEYGHVLLERVGKSTFDAKEERRADCLAGAYMSVAGPKWGTSDELWNKAFDATSWDGESKRSKEIRREMVNLGFEVPDNDPLGWCLRKA